MSVPANASYWRREEYEEAGLARASHRALVHQGVMWVIGGYVFNTSDYQMVKAYVSHGNQRVSEGTGEVWVWGGVTRRVWGDHGCLGRFIYGVCEG